MQSVVEAALRQLGWQGKSILAAGRTDTGVHAAGQVIAFDLDWPHPPQDLQNALNAHLPADVAARGARRVPPDFHPRYDAASRRYRYHLYCDAVRDPLRERYAWRVWPPAELTALQQAASCLPGRHDFAAFGTPPQTGGSTLRTVLRAEWQADGQSMSFDVTADAFLYHMARRLVAVQVEIGQGRLDVAVMPRYLQAGADPVQGLAPSQGLVLAEVCYPPEAIGE